MQKPKKNGFTVESSTDWARFHALLCSVLSRHAASPVHTIAELQHLFLLFPEHIQLKTINYNSELLAAALLFKFQSTVHTQYLATSELGKQWVP